MEYLTLLQTFGNLLMAYGLKYLWNMVNLFQFLVFIENWRINISPEAKIFLTQFRKLAFFEFVDTTWFTEWMSEELGYETETENNCEQDQNLKCPNRKTADRKSQDVEQAKIKEPETEMKRLGSINFVDNMGIMLFFAVLLLVLCVCIFISAIAVKYIPQA